MIGNEGVTSNLKYLFNSNHEVTYSYDADCVKGGTCLRMFF